MTEAPAPIRRLATLDFEASDYPGERPTFPVEVAACRLDTQECRAWLIRPHATWRDWAWNPSAERTHGLSRERLEREGRPAGEVLDDLGAFLEGCVVISDSESDQVWLAALAEAAGRPAPFSLGTSQHQLKLRYGPPWPEVGDDLERAERHAADRVPERYRAEPDARRLMLELTFLAELNGWV